MEFVNKELLKKGSMKFLGAMLWTGLDYPNRPFDWGHDPDVKKAFEEARKQLIAEGDIDGAAKLQLGHTVGYWMKPGSKKFDNWMGVVTPKDLDRTKVYPKEQRLIDICKQQQREDRQTWVYVNMTGKRDILPRLQGLLEKEGLRVGILRSTTCEPIDREAWIEEHGREYDVMLSHPELVKTGLDLFSKAQGGHNYPTIVFYETGYNLFTMRQAARRAWRIGQPCDCRVYYLYYTGTAQHKAMQLMSRKMSAAQALEGEFSEDGLAAMAGEDNMQMALAKQLSQRISENDMQRNWGKVKSGSKKKVSSKLDSLSPEQQEMVNAATAAQIIAETMEESEGKEPPIEAAREFAGVLERIALVDRNFKLVAPALAGDEYAQSDPATLEYEEAGPEKELDEETGDEFELEPTPVYGWTRRTQERLAEEIAEISAVNEASQPEEEDKPVILKIPEPEDDSDGFVEEDDDFEVPELTPEILARMLANMQAHGL